MECCSCGPIALLRKYQIYTTRPADASFRDDFNIVFNFLNKLQSEAATTKISKDMLFNDKNGKMIRFASNVFEKREYRVTNSPGHSASTKNVVYYEDRIPRSRDGDESDDTTLHSEDVPEEMDDETKNWKVETKFEEMLDLIKPDYRAVPLRVYQGESGDVFIEPAKVNDAIRNSLVEIHFTIHHTFLGNKSPPHNTFRANIEQIRVLKKGANSTTAYRSTDPRRRPIQLTTRSPPRSLSPMPTSKKSKTENHPSEKGKEKERNVD